MAKKKSTSCVWVRILNYLSSRTPTISVVLTITPSHIPLLDSHISGIAEGDFFCLYRHKSYFLPSKTSRNAFESLTNDVSYIIIIVSYVINNVGYITNVVS